MKRHIIEQLRQWKNSKSRKPLILQGARQVGKTYILTAFGESEYDNVAYLNFENTPLLHDLFSGSLKPTDIIKILSIELSVEIKPGKTLIIFDEVQACPAALNSLKYFNETANEYHICAAGSLLGVTLANTQGFPVGKVDFLYLYPLCFSEFLTAKGEDKLIEYINDIKKIEPLPTLLHEKLLTYYKEYLYTGGMPAAVLAYINSENFEEIRKTHNSILKAYRLDFAKHAPPNIIMKINQIWDVIPSQLAKENKKFVYSVIRKGARAQEFETAIQWLKEAGLIYKVYNISTPKLPLSGYMNYEIFKIYLCDAGLLGAMANLSAKTIIHDNEIFQEFRGSLVENYVAQELARQQQELFYWTSVGEAELDFLWQYDDKIYPLEVKSGTNTKKKSLLIYTEKYQPELQIRVSAMSLKLDGKILNCPLYLLGDLSSLMRTVYSQV